jgi:hypothetical protein
VADEPGKPPRKPRSRSASGPRSRKPPETGEGYEGQGDDKGEAVDGHAEFVARHFGGGVEATPELLDRAIEVWQRLPGAVVRGAAQVRPNRPVAPPGRDGEDKGKGATS